MKLQKLIFKYIYLRNNISQTVILLFNDITVWSSDAGNYSPSDIMMRIRTTNSDFIKQLNHRFGYINRF
jgi:hypothetical protein